MKIESFERAKKISAALEELKKRKLNYKDHLKRNNFFRSYGYIMDSLDKDIQIRIAGIVKANIESRIIKLEKEFERL